MTTDTKLLPLPEWMSNYTIPADGFEHDEDVMLDDRMRDYARANMELLLAENERMKNMAIMQAARASAAERETEALRAEVERLKVVAHGFVDEIALKDRRAERLAEALRGWWEARRPVSWTEDQHRSCPHVNHATDAEEALATALLRDQEEGK